jgi:hypothetical protein
MGASMPRQIRTAEQIQAIVRERIHQIREVRDDGAQLDVPIPPSHEPDGTGCNWEMRYFRNPGVYMDGISRIVAQARTEFNLA